MTLPWEAAKIATTIKESGRRSSKRQGPDPVTTEVLWNAFKAVADMMGVTVWRTAYSTIVRDARDVSAGICDVRGRLVAQADLIPALAGAMHISLKHILANDIPIERIVEGDMLIMNHPYHGGTHTSDIILYSPVFVEGEIIGFALNIAHHIDLGSMQVTGICRATDLYQEGILIPPMKLYERGVLNQTLWTMIETNTRYPKDVMGDMRAQIAANNLGVREILKLVEKYGKDVVVGAMDAVIDYGERVVRSEVERIPDGVYEAEGYLDDDGITRDERVKVRVRAIVKGSDVTYDFTGSSPQRLANVNSPPTAIMTTLGYITKSISDSDLPENEGTFLPMKAIFPPGSIVNPNMPGAVMMRHELVQRTADTLVRAFEKAAPDRVCAASAGNTCTLTIVSEEGIHYSNLGGGFGATSSHDGMSAIQVHLSKCHGVGVEDIELSSGTALERFELRQDSGGPGKHRGGLGVRMDVRITSGEAVLSLSSDAESTLPSGSFGGMCGLPGRKYLSPDTPEERRLYAKVTNFRLLRGSVVSFRTPGGGGYGDPLERDPEAVLRDVLDGYVSRRSAMHDYGVVIDEEHRLDLAATERKRSEISLDRPKLPVAVDALLASEASEPNGQPSRSGRKSRSHRSK